MTSWHSYPSPKQYKKKSVRDILEQGSFVVQEKYDGSQFSFGLIDGVLKVRSKGTEIDLDAVPDLFKNVVNHVKWLYAEDLLQEGWTYTGETISRQKHNVLTYARVPKGYFVLFDVRTSNEIYLDYGSLISVANDLEVEYPAMWFYYENTKQTFERLEEEHMHMESSLGGPDREGLVIKSLTMRDSDGKRAMAKIVSEKFKEKHEKTYGKSEQQGKNVNQALINEYKHEGRWRKAIIHLKETGRLRGEMADIPLLIKEIQQDVLTEHETEIKEQLWKQFKQQFTRGIVKGVPEWYKQQLEVEE